MAMNAQRAVAAAGINKTRSSRALKNIRRRSIRLSPSDQKKSARHADTTRRSSTLASHLESCAYYTLLIKVVGLPGIEPGLHAPHACVLPVYYSPEVISLFS